MIVEFGINRLKNQISEANLAIDSAKTILKNNYGNYF